jgi:hypothetical protein
VLFALGSAVLGWFRDQGASWGGWLRWLQTDRRWRQDHADVEARLGAALAAAGLPEVASGPEPEEVRQLREECSKVAKQRRLAETEYLSAEAARLGVALPEDRMVPTNYSPGYTPVWELVDGRRMLNALGIRELREAIAAEQRRRREPWIATTSAVVGIIGALTGLLALTLAHVRTADQPSAVMTATTRPTFATTTTTATTTSSSGAMPTTTMPPAAAPVQP